MSDSSDSVVRDEEELFQIEPPPKQGIFAQLPWWLIGLVAFSVAEMTAHPSIGVIVLCVKFGWAEFLNGYWLWRRDPWHKRGRTCAMFCVSSGLWSVWLWSLIILMGMAVYAMFRFQILEQPEDKETARIEAGTCLIVSFVSAMTATMTMVVAAITAWGQQLRIWVSRSMSASRKASTWPPQPPEKEANSLGWRMVMTVIACVFASFVGAAAMLNQPRPPANQAGFVFAMKLIGAFGLLPLSLFFGGFRLIAKVKAERPIDCWPELEIIARHSQQVVDDAFE